MEEIWIPIEGFECSYEISNFGHVCSKDHMVLRPSGHTVRIYTYLGQYLKPTIAKTGYTKVTLKSPDGKKSSYSLARLVAKHFLDDYSEDLKVLFKDGDPTNCNVSNLKLGV